MRIGNSSKVVLFTIALVFVAISILAVVFHFSDNVSWEAKGSKSSPDMRFTASEYYSATDMDRHAPYGTYLYLNLGSQIARSESSYLVFAGYCEKEFDFVWMSEIELAITCKSSEPQNVGTLASRAFGVKIVFQ